MSIDKTVVSIILGDGHVSQNGRISFHHCADQEEYLVYKVNLLNQYGYKFSIKKTTSMSYGKMRNFVKAEGYCSSDSKKLRELIYPYGIKIAPPEFVKDFGFKEWSFFYMDEGRANKLGHYNTIIQGQRFRVDCEPWTNFYEICTDALDNDSIRSLTENLLSLGVESRRSNRNRIIVSRAASKAIFYEGVREYVHPSMLYKISTKPFQSYNLQ